MLSELSQLCCCMTYAWNARQNAAGVMARLAASVAYRAHGCTEPAIAVWQSLVDSAVSARVNAKQYSAYALEWLQRATRMQNV
jgi:hypothetical protein